MKWTNELKDQLTKLAFEEKSNKEISEIMGITLKEVHDNRSRFGITVAKVKAAKENVPTKRTTEVIRDEIEKVKVAKFKASKKIMRCNERLEELNIELQKEILVEIARS